MEGKQRHGCLTAWLILMIVANSLAVLTYLFTTDALTQAYPGASTSLFIILGLLGIVNIACAVALLQWKKVGFYGFIATSLIASVVNGIIGVGFLPILGGIVGVAILYGVLNIGKEKAAWPQLD